MGRGFSPPHREYPHRKRILRGHNFCFVISRWRILVNSEVLNLKFFFIVSLLSGVWVDSVANFGFSSKTIIKDIIKCCHWARTTNIGLLYPNVRNNVGGDIPIDVLQPQYWRGCVPSISGGVDASGPTTHRHSHRHQYE